MPNETSVHPRLRSRRLEVARAQIEARERELHESVAALAAAAEALSLTGVRDFVDLKRACDHALGELRNSDPTSPAGLQLRRALQDQFLALHDALGRLLAALPRAGSSEAP